MRLTIRLLAALLLTCGALTACSRPTERRSPRWESLHPSSASNSRERAISTGPRIVRDEVQEANDLPSTTLLPVPFLSQAPLLQWDPLHQEACEEASLLMAKAFIDGTRTALDPEEGETALLRLVAWEEEHGYGEDVTIPELHRIAQEYFGLSSTVEEYPTIQRLKEILAEGHPIIVPAAGRTLGNPYFSGAGPWYHMLIIRGYDRNEFIVNDPGTRRGEAYHYDYETLLSAIHDWTGVREEIERGIPRILIIEKMSSL